MAAEAAVSSLVKILGDLLIQKVNFLRGVEGQVQWLKDELKRMQCFLKDAAEKQGKDERIRNWILEIRELAYDAQDVIEMFVLKVESRGQLGMYVSFPKHVYYVNKVAVEIECIKNRLEAIKKSRETYGIQDVGEGVLLHLTTRSENIEWRRRLASLGKDRDEVGLENEVKLLLGKAILNGRKDLSVATIAGMGGIGKSTLARKIYNNEAVAAEFDCWAWVVVSSEFTLEETIKQIIVELHKSNESKQKVMKGVKELEDSTRNRLFLHEKLGEMLYKRLEGKRYFIVLDDLWEHMHWDALRSFFPSEQGK